MLVRKRIAAFLFILAPLLAGQVDDIVKAEMARQHIPGVAIAVMKDGRVIRSAGYGMANLELNVAVTPRAAFKIGSISKQFLASGIMILAQDGKLRVTNKVSQYLPDAPSAWRGVTLRHLMSHTGGLTCEGPGFDPLKEQPDIQVIRSAYAVCWSSSRAPGGSTRTSDSSRWPRS
jgi:D-alanyl-D-alanine carboxypeptidase